MSFSSTNLTFAPQANAYTARTMYQPSFAGAISLPSETYHTPPGVRSFGYTEPAATAGKGVSSEPDEYIDAKAEATVTTNPDGSKVTHIEGSAKRNITRLGADGARPGQYPMSYKQTFTKYPGPQGGFSLLHELTTQTPVAYDEPGFVGTMQVDKEANGSIKVCITEGEGQNRYSTSFTNEAVHRRVSKVVELINPNTNQRYRATRQTQHWESPGSENSLKVETTTFSEGPDKGTSFISKISFGSEELQFDLDTDSWLEIPTIYLKDA